MTPIKLKDFLDPKTARARKASVDLSDINMAHAAPVENGQPVLKLLYDAQKGALVPVN